MHQGRKCRKTAQGSTRKGQQLAEIREKDWIASIDPSRPVLIAGPTASGKSSLAVKIAQGTGGVIINADALQVFSDWRTLTARPSVEDESRQRHVLYGHIKGTAAYSVGHWLRDIRPHLRGSPIIVGGTGLYFSALTAGLADIPPTPPEVREHAINRISSEGVSGLLAELDAATSERIDIQNPVRVQRAWEVLKATGKGLATWQDETAPPLLPLRDAQGFVLNAPKAWLNPRIAMRFDQMLNSGAIEEAQRNAAHWSPEQPSAKAIGAAELIAHVRGEMSLEDVKTSVKIKTRQYAKRQRSWFRARMADWQWIEAEGL